MEEGFPPGGVGSALSDEIMTTAETAGIAVTVQVTRFGKGLKQSLYIPHAAAHFSLKKESSRMPLCCVVSCCLVCCLVCCSRM